MVFAFPYHDPNGIYNEVFKRNLSLLKNIFDNIFISVTPITYRQNNEFIRFLSSEGIIIYENEENSNIGDHFRNALSISLKGLDNKEKVFFSFIDRILFVLESDYKDIFLKDLKSSKTEKLMIFERSTKAWNSHPNNYKKIEEFVNSLLGELSGIDIEMNFCALIVNKNIAEKILSESRSKGWEVVGEWLLLSMGCPIPLLTKKVDWLAWEDPFWEKADKNLLKVRREKNSDETLKRINTNLPFCELLIQDRFLNLYKR